MAASAPLHVKNYNTALPVKGRIGKKYISALHVMRKRSRSLLSLRPRLHSASRCQQGQGAWPTGAGRQRMIIVSNRIPSRVNDRAAQILSLYASGTLKPCRIKCGNLSLRIGRKWRLLSRNNGSCWEVMSHEKYNQLKDRKS